MAMYASQVRGIVLYHANHLKLLVTYGEIATALGTTPRGAQLGQALALITEDDFKNKRPLTTAIVVNAETKRPGKGFFDQCAQLHQAASRDGVTLLQNLEEGFWESQIKQMGVAPFYLSELDQIEKRPDHELDDFGRRIVAKIGDHRTMVRERNSSTLVRGKSKFGTPAQFDRVNVAEGIGPKLKWLWEAAKLEPRVLVKPVGLSSESESETAPGQNTAYIRKNGGVACDVLPPNEGACACGAWHQTESHSALPT